MIQAECPKCGHMNSMVPKGQCLNCDWRCSQFKSDMKSLLVGALVGLVVILLLLLFSPGVQADTKVGSIDGKPIVITTIESKKTITTIGSIGDKPLMTTKFKDSDITIGTLDNKPITIIELNPKAKESNPKR